MGNNSAKALLLQSGFYIFAAGSGDVVNFFTRQLVSPIIGFVPSLVLAHFCGLLINFFFSKVLVFKTKDTPILPELIRFTISSAGGFSVQFCSALLALQFIKSALPLEQAENYSHVIGLGLSFGTNFFLHKFFTFKIKKEAV